ncbi:MAG: MFS transporter [Hyphomicrobiaceae bacterium]
MTNDLGVCRPQPRVSHRNWLFVLGATLIIQTINAYLYFLTPTLAPAISQMVGMGSDFVGWLVAIGILGSIGFMLIGTPIVQWLGPMRALQFGTLLGGCGVCLMAVGTPLTLLVANVLMGIGYGPSSPAGSEVLQRFTPREYRNLVFSVRQAGVPIAGLTAGLMLPLIQDYGGWSWVIATTLLLVVASTLAVSPLRSKVDRDGASGHRPSLGNITRLSNLMAPFRSLLDDGLLGLSVSGALLAVGHGCWTAYLVTWLNTAGDLTLKESGAAFAVMQISSIFGRLAMGALADRWVSPLITLRLVAVLSALVSLVAGVAGSLVQLYGYIVFSVAAGLFVSSWNGIQIAEIVRRSNPERISASASGATIIMFIGLIVGPILFSAILRETGDFSACFLVTSILTAMAYGFYRRTGPPV